MAIATPRLSRNDSFPPWDVQRLYAGRSPRDINLDAPPVAAYAAAHIPYRDC